VPRRREAAAGARTRHCSCSTGPSGDSGSEAKEISPPCPRPGGWSRRRPTRHGREVVAVPRRWTCGEVRGNGGGRRRLEAFDRRRSRGAGGGLAAPRRWPVPAGRSRLTSTPRHVLKGVAARADALARLGTTSRATAAAVTPGTRTRDGVAHRDSRGWRARVAPGRVAHVQDDPTDGARRSSGGGAGRQSGRWRSRGRGRRAAFWTPRSRDVLCSSGTCAFFPGPAARSAREFVNWRRGGGTRLGARAGVYPATQPRAEL
jgi:hypothetical protein